MIDLFSIARDKDQDEQIKKLAQKIEIHENEINNLRRLVGELINTR